MEVRITGPAGRSMELKKQAILQMRREIEDKGYDVSEFSDDEIFKYYNPAAENFGLGDFFKKAKKKIGDLFKEETKTEVRVYEQGTGKETVYKETKKGGKVTSSSKSSNFDEKQHPRAEDGKFTKAAATSKKPAKKGLEVKPPVSKNIDEDIKTYSKEIEDNKREMEKIDSQIPKVKAERESIIKKLDAEDEALWKEHTRITNTLKDRTPEGQKRMKEIKDKSDEIDGRRKRTFDRYDKLIRDAERRKDGLNGRNVSNENTLKFLEEAKAQGHKTISESKIEYPKKEGVKNKGSKKAVLD